MPSIVDELPKATRGREKQYDFTQYFDQIKNTDKAVEFIRGDDFTSEVATMRQLIYKAAADANLKPSVRTYSRGEGEDEKQIVAVSVRDLTDEDRQKAKEAAEKRAATRKANEKANANGGEQAQGQKRQARS